MKNSWRDPIYVLQMLAFAAIVVGVCFFIYNSAKKIEYKWRWNRVPSYLINVDKEEYRARTTGLLKLENGAVYIEKADGSKDLVAQEAKLLMPEGSQVIAGDLVASYKSVKAGPLMRGLAMTLKISFFSIIFAIFLGIVTGLMRISPIVLLRKLAITYVEIVRGTPLLVQIFVMYFFFGTIFKGHIEGFFLFNNGFYQIGVETVMGVAALALFTGAYIAEIVRAGIQSIPKGQTEAARSLGFNYFRTMAYIILPQATKRSLPPMAGQFISLIKDSSLVSVIAITDLTKAGREVIASSLSTFEIWSLVAVMYLILTSALSFILNRFELKLAKSD
jgi:polar amino acid transport system permease protein